MSSQDPIVIVSAARTPIGGLLARQYGITAPFWFGFVGSAILVAVMWRQFDKIVHAGDDVPHGTD